MKTRVTKLLAIAGLSAVLPAFPAISAPSVTHEVRTNEVLIPDAPAWLKESRIDRVVARIQDVLEWDIRQVRVQWYRDQAQFEAVHGFGPSVLAFARKSDNTVHVGPRVDETDFDATFGHELVHVIVFQKYKDAIPKWLEEGLANYLAKRGRVDYAWLSRQPAVSDVRELVHPFQAYSAGPEAADRVRYHYEASQALAEMIAKHCDLADLLKLSVGKKLESYLSTYCGISDVNAEFRKWVARQNDIKAPAPKPAPRKI